ncbi:IS3 family transposase [Streptomyces sp. NBC_01643]|uniref:IS3 family transposase n=1 Tax=Streptomyces sp. NBC_01643 TaxID=2975906 RepID=UPI00386E694A
MHYGFLPSRPSSTGRRSARSVHRRAPAGVRKRAGLPCPCQSRTEDRDEHLLRHQAAGPSPPVRDAELKTQISHVPADSSSVYRVRKVGRHLHREGIPVARCTVARLMRDLGPPERPTQKEDPHYKATETSCPRGQAPALGGTP